MPGRRGALLVSAGAALAIAVVATACGGSDYRYIENASEGAYFRVPDDWAVERVNFAAEREGRPDPLLQRRDPWQIRFDGRGDFDPPLADGELPTKPVGGVTIYDVTGSQARDDIDLAFLRRMAINGQADPLEEERNGSPFIELIEYEEIVRDSGLRGVHLVFNLQVDDERWQTVDHSAFVDQATNRLYHVLLTCSSECFLEHSDEIADVVDSWAVRK